MILTVDRIEGTYAVCIDENENTYNIPLSSLPPVSERDVIEASFVLRPDLRKEKESKVKSLFEKLKNK
ncbi:MAG: DUF3006 domain-containing protein [Clostridia bacterium]|nr:DUF3006 domain-containing protein [Clostridia bacterium]